MKKLILLLIFSAIFISCSPTAKFIKYTEQEYEPTSEIAVLQTKPPERDYIELGLLSIEVQNNEEDVILELKKKAREIGANAIIILGEKNTGSVAVPIGNMYYNVQSKELEAVAIRYKKEN